MGCAWGKPLPVEDSRRRSPPERSPLPPLPAAGALQVDAPAKRTAVTALAASSLRREEAIYVRTEAGVEVAAAAAGKKVVNKPARANWPDAERRRVAERQAQRKHPMQVFGSVPKAVEGEQVAAGWPAWLATVAGEAIMGWVPRKADSFEKLDKVIPSAIGLNILSLDIRDTDDDELYISNSRFLILQLLGRKIAVENRQIGQGTYSSVYRARDLDNKKIVALKKVRFDNLEPESVKFMAREILILRRLDHPNIVKLEGLVTSRMSCSLYLVFEYMEHDLAGLASSPGLKFSEPQVKCYMQQLLHGLGHCHNREILHRDIKGSNLLIDDSGILKIADFGLASFFDPEQRLPLTSRVVTLWYRPPELLLGATNYGVEQLHKIFKLCGSPSEEYWRKSRLPHATIFKPQQPYRRCVAEAFKDFPPSALTLLEVLLSVDPADRGTAASALKNEIRLCTSLCKIGIRGWGGVALPAVSLVHSSRLLLDKVVRRRRLSVKELWWIIGRRIVCERKGKLWYMQIEVCSSMANQESDVIVSVECSNFFTRKPLACDPSSLPKYPPSKEFDSKRREEEARRQGATGGNVHKLVAEKGVQRESKAIPAPDANAELTTSLQVYWVCSKAGSRWAGLSVMISSVEPDILVGLFGMLEWVSPIMPIDILVGLVSQSEQDGQVGWSLRLIDLAVRSGLVRQDKLDSLCRLGWPDELIELDRQNSATDFSKRSRSEKFDPRQEDIASGFPIEPPQVAPVLEVAEEPQKQLCNRSFHSGPLVHRSQLPKAWKNAENLPKIFAAADLSGLPEPATGRRKVLSDDGDNDLITHLGGSPAGRLSESGNKSSNNRKRDQIYHQREDESSYKIDQQTEEYKIYDVDEDDNDENAYNVQMLWLRIERLVACHVRADEWEEIKVEKGGGCGGVGGDPA
ncbi:hypothetical protein ZIOFF_013382 [Zingiber officinale]|uniref:[RNA-polymerase]-subunit kinase n=1 Tax=Zingiber officinale TaxID=94328 RepID=A0A8J5H9W9_ZINOF|nr:hypothetical protein ZIOFF_013382 [Zingiber officinale]